MYRTGDLGRWLADGTPGGRGPDGPPAQGARLPRRAGRDRERSRRAPGHRRGVGGGVVAPRGRHPPCRLLHADPRRGADGLASPAGREPAALPARPAAQLHDPGGLHRPSPAAGPGGQARHGSRRQPGAGRTRAVPARQRPRAGPGRAAHAHRGGAVRPVGQAAQPDHVGLDDEFFALGGDSLLAAEMLAHTDALFGISADSVRSLTRCLLRDPTLRAFAAAVEDARAGRLSTDGDQAEVDFGRETRLSLKVRDRGAPAAGARPGPGPVTPRARTGATRARCCSPGRPDSSAPTC